VNVQKQMNPFELVEAWSEAISRAELPTHSADCPHCGISVRYPTIARAQDIKDFELLMEQVQIVLERHGYTGKILSEIQAQCSIAMRKGCTS
jgi:hypothetical protein